MPSRDQVVVVGASGFGRECLDVLEAMRADGVALDILGVVDDDPSAANLERLSGRGIAYLGSIAQWLATEPHATRFVLGIGNPSIRQRLAENLENAGVPAFTAIHPSAVIGSRAEIGPGAVICAGVMISTNVRLGLHVHINPNATVGHDAVLDDFVSVNPAAVISGEVIVGQSVLVGAGAVILQRLILGERSVIGAAALVTKDVPAGLTAKGLPGRWNA